MQYSLIENTCQVVLSLFVGISLVTIIVRLVIRIHTRHKLYIDDYVLLFGSACFISATYLNFANSRTIFLHNAWTMNPKIIPTFVESNHLLNSFKILRTFLKLIWTTMFFVKFSFLIFFKQLIDRVSQHITIYYWIGVIFTVLFWMFIICEHFILCPHFDIKGGKPLVSCFRYHGNKTC